MARAKTLGGSKTKVDVIKCYECDCDKKRTDFYKSYTNKSNVVSMCKECFLNSCVNDDGKIEKEKMINALQKIDKPFIESLFIKNANKYDNAKQVIGTYIKDISLPQYKECTFKDSMYDKSEVRQEVTGSSVSEEYKYTLTPDERFRLVNKWGDFSDVELIKFERKYQTMSKSYQILSQMHEESLINVCRLEVFYATALKEKNASEIKLFGDMLSSAKKDAKLNPNQLSKNDLSSTGANSFGEISKIVAQSRPNVRLHMKYLKHPNDEIDFAIMCYINNLREAKGLKPATYEEINAYYIDKIKQFDKTYNADVANGDMGEYHE